MNKIPVREIQLREIQHQENGDDNIYFKYDVLSRIKNINMGVTIVLVNGYSEKEKKQKKRDALEALKQAIKKSNIKPSEFDKPYFVEGCNQPVSHTLLGCKIFYINGY